MYQGMSVFYDKHVNIKPYFCGEFYEILTKSLSFS